MISGISISFLSATMALFTHSLIDVVLFLSSQYGTPYTLHIKEHPGGTHLVNLDGHATSSPHLATTHSICTCAGKFQTDQMTKKFPSQNMQARQEKNNWTHKTKLQSVSFTMTQYNQSVSHEGQSTWTHIQLHPLQCA